MWQRRSNAGYAVNDSPFGASAGPDAGDATQSPGGSVGTSTGKTGAPVSYVNSSPWSGTNNSTSLNRYHPKHLYGRRGHQQGGQGGGGGGSMSGVQGGGFARLAGGNISTGTIGGASANPRGLFSGGMGT